MDIISNAFLDFISYIKTLMTWDNVSCEWMNSFECWLQNSDIAGWGRSLNNTLWSIWDKISDTVGGAFWSIRNAFMSTSAWKVVWFIRDMISFLFYGVRSIILLLWNLLYSILNWFVALFTQLLSTFTDLSFFMWSTTSLLISLFILVLLIIWFQFLLRFFTWKYHYNKVKK